MASTRISEFLLASCVALAILPLSVAQEPVLTGPATEKRFPPLKVPPGF